MSVDKSRASRARDVALFRYALIRPLADPGLSPAERGALARELAARVHQGPFGEPVTVSRASVDRWVRGWRAGGFDALIPTERQVQARTDAAVLEPAARLNLERLARTAAHIARIIEQDRGWAPSARTLQRLFDRLELGTRPDGVAPGGVRPVRGRRPGRAVGVRRAARPDHRRETGGAVRPAG